MQMRQRKLGGDDESSEVVMNMGGLLSQSSEDETVITVSMLREAAKEAAGAAEDAKGKTEMVIKEGALDKRRRDLFDGLIPEFCDCRKKWKLNRHIVCFGMYIYRFDKEDEDSTLKGVPIPLLNATVKPLLFRGPEDPENEADAPFCLEVSTLRKTYVYRAANDAEVRSWVNHLNQRKMLAHKEVRQHASVHPAISKYDKMAKTMYAQRMERDLSDAKESHNQAEAFLGRSGMSPMHIGGSTQE